jgi:hypothetical protein
MTMTPWTWLGITTHSSNSTWGDALPHRLYHLAEHGVVEQHLAIVGYNGDKVRTGLCLIVASQSDGTTMVFITIVPGHPPPSYSLLLLLRPALQLVQRVDRIQRRHL